MILGSGMSIRSKTPKEPVRPPETGTGSGHKAWAKYAEQTGLDVPEGSTKNDIIELVNDSVDEQDELPLGSEPEQNETE